MKSLAFIVAGLSTVLAGAVAGPIMFEEIAQRAGLAFTTNSCPTPNKNQPETMVAGVALLDYDNDGYLDVYFVNGAAIPSLKKESPQYWNRLFHNNHDGTFTDVTEKAGVAGEGYGMGVAVGDLRQRRMAGHLCCQRHKKPAFSQQSRRHVYGRDGQSGCGWRHAGRQKDVVSFGRLG